MGAAAASCTEQNTAPLGTGPYRIVGFTVNEEAVYERNPFYRGAEPYFDRVVLRGGRGRRLRGQGGAGEGRGPTTPGTSRWSLRRCRRWRARGTAGSSPPSPALVERIVLNQTDPDAGLGDDRSEYLDGRNPHPFLTHRPIARALSMAIDRRLIAERLYGFAGKPACNLITGPPNYVSTANDDCLSQDIEGAKRLLDEAGVVDGDGDGVREYEGTPLRIVYQTSANSIRRETQELVRDWWRQIGVETELVQHDAALFFGGDPVTDREASYRRFFADVQMFANGPGIDPQHYLAEQLCAEIPERENGWAGGNIPRGCNPEYDVLYAELAQTRIGAEREDLVRRLNDVLVQSYYEIPIVERGFVSAHLNTLQGVRINAWDSEMWNIGEWRRSR